MSDKLTGKIRIITDVKGIFSKKIRLVVQVEVEYLLKGYIMPGNRTSTYWRDMSTTDLSNPIIIEKLKGLTSE